MNEEPQLEHIRLLLARLERISADSHQAHRASGLRGALFDALEKLEKGQPVQRSEIERLTSKGFSILEDAIAEKRRWKGIQV